MAARTFGLGKGLSALIPDPEPVPIEEPTAPPSDARDEPTSSPAGQTTPAVEVGATKTGGESSASGGILRVALGRIEPNPDQPRKTFSEESIAELADSIRRNGLIQPIIVEGLGEGRYRIVAGERRWRAAQVAALKEIPVIVRSFSAEKRLEIALIENVQREDLNPVEEAEAYRGIMEITGCTQEEVADKVGKSRPAIANALRLLKLGPSPLAALRDGSITPGHARALLAVADPADRELLFARVIAEELSVRQAEAAALEFGAGKRPRATGVGTAGDDGRHGEGRRVAEIVEAEQRLIEAFGTKVSIRGDLQKGTIAIEYYSMDDLGRILEAARVGDRLG
jgi:ParB family chromosome partitioning protein